jgi:Tfp pilus assembly protein PilF
MQILVEDFVPYDRSVQWRIHDAYFAQRGVAAWKSGDIPYTATSNYPIARQHARLLTKVIRELAQSRRLGADEEIWVLEIGAGLGQFAANFLRALDEGCGAFARQVAPRLRYVLSDYSPNTVREAILGEGIARYVSEGRIVPALFDLRQPARLVDVNGSPLDAPLTALISNYVCCVSPMKVLRKSAGGFAEKFVQVSADLPDGSSEAEFLRDLLDTALQPEMMKGLKTALEWRAVELERLFPEGPHADAIRDATAPFADATIACPSVFFDMLRLVERRMRPGGLILVNDYGSADSEELEGLSERPPKHYGNTMNHGVSFPLLEAFCRRAGLAVVRTLDPFRSVHSAALRTGGAPPPAFVNAFQRLYVDRTDGEDLLDFASAGREAGRQSSHARAARLYGRCLRLDPDHVEAHYRVAEAAIENDQPAAALPYLERGRALDVTRDFDFDFQLGRALFRLERYDEALVAYERSLVRDPDAATHTNIGRVHEERGDLRQAYHAFLRALTLNPSYERAQRLMEALKGRWIETTLGPPTQSGARN